jgi:uncharacterized membrane protein YbhN (UPF0104 family)
LGVVLRANGVAVLTAVALIVPLILVKTIRWQGILKSQGVSMALGAALQAYFASLFIGFLTPGRLGEFVRALYVQKDHKASAGKAIASVLADRLFDLCALLIAGGAALFAFSTFESGIVIILLPAMLLGSALGLYLHHGTYACIRQLFGRLGGWGRRLFAPEGWIAQIRDGLLMMRWPLSLLNVGWTVLAYALFFLQAYILAKALSIPLTYLSSMYAVALGSLAALLPVSISGLGTREAVIVAFLGTLGVSREMALGYSLLVFATFNLAGGLMGGIAWMIKPAPLGLQHDSHNQGEAWE